MSARVPDINGWWEVQDNPISRVGIFPYLGRSIGRMDEPDRVFQVYRPAEELADPEAIASFRLIPWVDDHKMLGDGFTPAENKGVGGVIGENVWFDPSDGDGVLKANIKCFSKTQAETVSRGKKELSAGYRCRYDFTPGVFNGKEYEVIQRTLRGNHLATVKDGRMGPQVAVLDYLEIAMDGQEFVPVTKKTKGARPLTAADLERINATPALQTAMCAALDEAMAEEDEDDKTPPAKDSDADKKAADADLPDALKKANEEKADADKKAADEDDAKAKDSDADKKAADEDDAKAKDEPAKGMDEAEVVRNIAVRDRLATGLKPIIGTFDHAEMTRAQVAAYGAKKLNLAVAEDQAEVAVVSYLAGRSSAPVAKQATGMDAKDTPKAPGFIARRFK